LDDIKEDLEALRARFPAEPGGMLTADGRPALGARGNSPNLLWSKPLGGTELANGRHQVKLFEPEAKETAPREVPFLLLGALQHSDACLRVYGHPQLLRIAASVNGEDFDDGIHGFNFMAQVYGSTAVNGGWVLPGTHKAGKLDIKQLVAKSGSERLEGAVPIVCAQGDVIICNRQLVHGPFPNCGLERRLTVNFGFHRRSSVLGVMGAGITSGPEEYDEGLIKERSRVIGYAIDARQQRYPEEDSYQYQPFVQSDKNYCRDNTARQAIKDYNLHDLSI
jgi:hypothetical protein